CVPDHLLAPGYLDSCPTRRSSDLVLRERPDDNYLIYRSGQIPEGPANWLLDLELAYGIFTADRGALMRADLGLSVAGAEELIAAHDSFFVSGKLVAKFKDLLRDGDDLVTVQAS